MLCSRRLITLLALATLAPMAAAQTGPMLTPSAFVESPGYFGLDLLGLTIGKEPNFLTFAQSGAMQLRTRIDGPVVRLHYVPSERAEFTAEFNAQTFAIKDPRYNQTISDFGDAILRAKLGLARGETSVSPAVALQFQVTLPNTSFGNGLGPNTIRLASNLNVGYRTERLTLNGSGGIAIEDEPLRAHEQRDFATLYGSIAYKVTDGLEVFADGGGYFGEGVPGAIAKREVRVGVQNHRELFGRDTTLYLAGRRGLVTFQGKWGLVVGLTTALRSGVPSRARAVDVPPLAGGAIAGFVLSAQGSPVSGAEVFLRAPGVGAGLGGGMNAQTVLTDSYGQFRFERLAPATYTVGATLGTDATPTFEVSVGAGEVRGDLRLALKGASGLVIEARDAKTGLALRGVLVRVRQQATDAFNGLVNLDANGRGEIPGISAGSYAVVAQASGYAPLSVPDVRSPSTALRLDFTAGGTAEVTTTEAFLADGPKSGQLISLSGAPVGLVLGGPGAFGLSQLSQRLENLAPGLYRLTVEGGIEKTFEIVEGGLTVVPLP